LGLPNSGVSLTTIFLVTGDGVVLVTAGRGGCAIILSIGLQYKVPDLKFKVKGSEIELC
jgi:hypothetical protein